MREVPSEAGQPGDSPTPVAGPRLCRSIRLGIAVADCTGGNKPRDSDEPRIVWGVDGGTFFNIVARGV